MYIVSCFSKWCPSRFQQFSLQKSCLNHLQKYVLAKSEPDILAVAMQQTGIQSPGPVMSPMPHSLLTITDEIRPENPANQIGNFAPPPTEESVLLLVKEHHCPKAGEQPVEDVALPSNLTLQDLMKLMKQLNIIPTETLIGNGGPEGVSTETPSNPPGVDVDLSHMMGVVDIQKQPAGPLPMATDMG